MSLFKYFGEQNDSIHGGKLFWSEALGGLPIRGLRNSNFPFYQYELDNFFHVSWDFKFKEFDLSKQEDRDLYQYVMDRIVNRWFIQLHKEYVKDSSGKVQKIYLEWAQRYQELKKNADALLFDSELSTKSEKIYVNEEEQEEKIDILKLKNEIDMALADIQEENNIDSDGGK